MTEPVAVRVATAADFDFMAEMLVQAANWDDHRGTTRAIAEADPHSWRYLERWPLPTDFGVIATEGTGPVGAAWARFGTAEDAGYGYVADDIPELTIAVSPSARRRGVGRTMLIALINIGRTLGQPGISLSVEDGNHAARSLYESLDFLPVGRNGGADTMLLTLSHREPAT
jgi:ribosomal protein S18 acetylase RimI-like enzyme